MKIETLEQLEALPEGTVIEDSGGGITRRIDDGSWSEIGQTIGLWTYDSEEMAKYLPAVVLIPAVVTDEMVERAAEMIFKVGNPRGKWDDLYPYEKRMRLQAARKGLEAALGGA